MPFAYYERLSARGKAIYRKSDEVTSLTLSSPAALHPVVAELRAALARDERRAVEAAAQRLVQGLAEQLGLPAVAVTVLAVRPASSWGELHGLYTREERHAARIQLWMRTVRQRRVVAFRTFLRTLLHELGHHVDYERLSLADSFHTEGFFRRESSLFRQLVPEPADQDSGSSRPGRK
jgi:isopenicillin N synthase-like dioxygenase